VSDDLDFMPVSPARRDEDAKGAKPSDAERPEDEDRAPGERAELPTWNRSRRKRKANVKAEKQDDAFQRGVRKAGRRAIDAPKLVIGAIVIGVVVIASGVALHNHRIKANAEAARALQGATAAVARGVVLDDEELLEQLRRIQVPVFASEDEREAAITEALAAAKSSGRKQVEQNATMVAAAKAMRDGEFEAAVAAYDEFLAAAPDDHPLRFLAIEGKGNALEAKGDLEAALEQFRALAPHPISHFRPMALYHQGRVLEALDRKDEALAIYVQYFEEFPPTREEIATPLVRRRAEALDPDFGARYLAPPPLPTL
jgi:tetratricopeptide (TPR) repeat protein